MSLTVEPQRIQFSIRRIHLVRWEEIQICFLTIKYNTLQEFQNKTKQSPKRFSHKFVTLDVCTAYKQQHHAFMK